MQKVKLLCNAKGITPAIACRESGAGESLIYNVNRGRIPAVDRFQLLAAYLGVTTSELLGETNAPTIVSGDSSPAERLLGLLENLNPEGQERLVETADDMVRSGKYSKKGGQPGLGSKEA